MAQLIADHAQFRDALFGGLSRARKMTCAPTQISCENKRALDRPRVAGELPGDLLILDRASQEPLVRIFLDEDGYAHWRKEV